MSEEFISEITLEYLMNKEQYGKYLGKKTLKPEKSNHKDKRFYKKRIYELTRQLLNDQKPERMYPDVTGTFEAYLNICIEYFKSLDKTDIIQEDFVDYENKIINTEVEVMDDLNHTFMRSIKISEPNSLEKIVKRTSTKIVNKQIYPKQKDINLKDPILKNKGICKKKNIINYYEESKEEVEKD